MCKWGANSMVRLCKPMPVSGRTEIGVDACLATLVQALNDAGIETTACCCGHGKLHGRIDLADGRVLLIDSPDSHHGLLALVEEWRYVAAQFDPRNPRRHALQDCADKLAALLSDGEYDTFNVKTWMRRALLAEAELQRVVKT